MRDPVEWGVTAEFLRRAKEESERVEWTPPPCVIHTQKPTFDGGPISVDIETAGNTLLCIGFCQHDPDVYVISADDIERDRAYYQDVFNTHTLIFHNGMFDVAFLQRYGFVIPEWVDTMLLHHTIYSELRHSLAFVASVYTKMPYWKYMAHMDEAEEEDK